MMKAIISTQSFVKFFEHIDFSVDRISRIDSRKDILIFHVNHNNGLNGIIEMCASIDKPGQGFDQNRVRWDWHYTNLKSLPDQPMVLTIEQNKSYLNFSY